MFIISKEMMKATEIKSYHIWSEHNNKTIREADDIHQGIMDKAYWHGSTANAKRCADDRRHRRYRNDPTLCLKLSLGTQSGKPSRMYPA